MDRTLSFTSFVALSFTQPERLSAILPNSYIARYLSTYHADLEEIERPITEIQ